MFGSMQSGAQAYAKVGMETGVVAATPHKLIVMLFEGAQIALVGALQHMERGEIAEKGKAISKAIMIIENGLRASLDKSVGGDIALNLDALYGYMSNRLLLANLNNQAELIQEVQVLLADIKDAWDNITPGVPTRQDVSVETTSPIAGAYDALGSNMPRLMKA
ncbi:MAG TPA: flagellar export chaperone FliS [Oxalicibacterium sp.]|nr:flagellar export chaperone FliS [Oxalicibacterium sp.]